MPEAYVDMSTIDVEHVAVPEARLREHLPQRHEFQMIDGVCSVDPNSFTIVAYKDLQENDWWTRGHFPNHALLPGVLMAEGAAQAATVLWKELVNLPNITIGLGGFDAVRIRGQVNPPSRVYFLVKRGSLGSRMARFPTQAWVDGKLVFEGTVLGVAL